MVYLCHYCHNEPPLGVHHNTERMTYLKQIGQRAFNKHYPNENFIKIFDKNYLWKVDTMNETKILEQARNLILNEGWHIRKVCKKFGVTRAWLRSKLEQLADKELNLKLQKDEPVNEAALTLPVEDDLELDDEVVQILPQIRIDTDKGDEVARQALNNYCLIHNLNHTQFGKKCGLDHTTIGKIVNGKIKITDRTLRFIQAGLNINLDEFLDYANKKPVEKRKTKIKSNLETDKMRLLEIENKRLLTANSELQTENYTLTKKVKELGQIHKSKDEEIAKLQNDLKSVKCNLAKTMQDRKGIAEELQDLKAAKPVNADAELVEKQKRVIMTQKEEIALLKKMLDQLLK